jgi:hypothetical protein
VVFISSVMDEEMSQPREDAVAALETPAFLSPWAFEFTPASSEDVDESYLRKVRDADVVLWLIGRRTTEPVEREIREALKNDRPLLVVKLSGTSPDERTQALLAEVAPHVKWVEVDPVNVRVAVALTLSDEFVRAWRRAKPTRARASSLDERGRMSRARSIVRWRAAGLSRREALVLADDLDVGKPPDIARPTPDLPLRVVRGDVGAGKSLVSERLFQEAAAEALANPDAPIPVWLHANEVGEDLMEAIAREATDVGGIEQQGAFVVIDGAEEAGMAAATTLLEAARLAVEAWPGVRVVIASRPIAPFVGAEEAVDLPPLDEDQSLALISRVAGRDVSGHGWPAAVKDAIKRPLWAILLAVDLREGATTAASTGELLRNLVRRALAGHPDRSEVQLQALARLSTDRGELPVAMSELGRIEELEALRESGLVVERNGALRFGLPILNQWFAARSLQDGQPTIEELAQDPTRLDLWRYAVVIALGEGNWPASRQIMEPLLRHDPGFASDVLRAAVREYAGGEGTRVSLPPPLEAGARVFDASKAWLDALGLVARLLPIARADGTPHQLGVYVEGGSLETMWRHLDDLDDDVVILPPEAHVFSGAPGWGPGRLSHPAAEEAWPWRWIQDMVVSGLKPLISEHQLALDDGPAAHEAAWRQALALTNHGSLRFEPLPLDELEGLLARIPADAVLLTAGRQLRLEVLRCFVNGLRAEGETELKPPWPGWDLDPATGGGWVWDPYSPEQLQQRTERVFAGAMSIYSGVVDDWLAPLRRRMQKAVVLPAVLRGSLYFVSAAGGGGGPAIDWTLDPLPLGEDSRAEITLADEGSRRDVDQTMERLRCQQERLRAVRPEAARWISAESMSQVLSIFGDTPATDVAYEWLAKDLKRIGLHT